MDKHQRRQLLLARNLELEAQGKDCAGCAGTCCTFESNSMMITPLETMDLLEYLQQAGRLTAELKARLQESVERFRLDYPMATGRGTFLRRTYTCPFFQHQELGCSIPREAKPYGCLGFTNHHLTERASQHCHAEPDLLEKRELHSSGEDQKNVELRRHFELDWEKKPIPLALLELWHTHS
jgi:Fe-S-cluster containining protein